MTVRGYFLLSLTASVVGGSRLRGRPARLTGTGTGGSGATVGTGGRAGVIGTGGTVPPPIPPCVGKCTDFPARSVFRRRCLARRGRHVRYALGRPRAVRDRAGRRRAVPEQLAAAARARSGFDRRPQDHLPRREAGQRSRRLHERRVVGDAQGRLAKLAHHVVEEDITVTVQAPTGGVTSVRFKVAPVGAGGSMVFWAANPAAARQDRASRAWPRTRSSRIRC